MKLYQELGKLLFSNYQKTNITLRLQVEAQILLEIVLSKKTDMIFNHFSHKKSVRNRLF